LKIKFIYPKFDKFLETYPELAEMPAIAATWAYTMPPASGIPIMAGLTPDDVEWHVQDQNIEEINFEDDSDLIAISYFTPQASYAYEIGDEFMLRGKTVIMGGMHPSMVPDDVSEHCHSICIGEVDTLWKNILEDFKKGQLKSVYKACRLPSPEEIASPKPDTFDSKKYDWRASLISVTRGCPHNCTWCNIPIYQGREIRFRPLDIVEKDIQKLCGREFYITDDIITLNREKIHEYIIELCERIKDYKVSMLLSGSPAMNRDIKFLNLIAKAGCKNMYIVFASDTYSKMFYMKNKSIWDKCIDLVTALEDFGIRFFGSFSIGFDFAGEEQFDLILEFCKKAKVKTAEFFIATPFPNTPFWHHLKEENRLVQPIDWKLYNCANLVFKPKLVSEEKLLEGFISLWKEFYKYTDSEESLSSFQQKSSKNTVNFRKHSQKGKNGMKSSDCP
jgi:radical SAM superfamily enzyme YgiQ (UPF0313 family)